MHPYSKFWLSIWILKLQRTGMSFKSSFWVLEDTGGSWLGLAILILTWIWSLIFDRPMFWIVALYCDLEGTINIHVKSWGFGGHWRFLTEIFHPDIDWHMVTGMWFTQIPNFVSLSRFWRCKEHPCPLCPDLGHWWMLEVPDWGLGSWPWFW